MIISVNTGYLIGNSGINGGSTGNLAGTLDNQGTITQPSGYIYLNDSVVIKNEGTYDFTGNASINYGNSSNDLPSINNTNTGLFEQTGSTGTATVGVPFENQGTASAVSATLFLAGGVVSTGGAYNAQGAATINFGDVLTGDFSGAGAGMVGLGGNIEIGAAGATFNFSAGLFQRGPTPASISTPTR